VYENEQGGVRAVRAGCVLSWRVVLCAAPYLHRRREMGRRISR